MQRTAGHSVTLFNRGSPTQRRSPTSSRSGGDRAADLTGWPAAHGMRSSTSGYVPHRAPVRTLAQAAPHYTFISTRLSTDVSRGGTRTRARELADPTVEGVDGETYGPLKAPCEAAVTEERLAAA